MNRPIDTNDELLLNRLLDDDLSPEEAVALRARLEREPDLRRAYEAITRIDALLTARRSDQPRIDWSSFHALVMDRIESEIAGSHTIRLARFLRVALPLAAAAAIALLVWFWPHSGQVIPGGGPPLPQMALKPEARPTFVAQDSPGEKEVLVRYVRPDAGATDESPAVSYARSDELFREYRAMDERNRSRESGRILLASNVEFNEPDLRTLFD